MLRCVQRFEGGEGVSGFGERAFKTGETASAKALGWGSQAQVCLVNLKNNKEAPVAEAEWCGEDVVGVAGDEVREEGVGYAGEGDV